VAKSKQTVLVVEDNTDDLDKLREILKKQGYEVLTQKTVESAQKTLSKRPVDLLVLDVMLDDKESYHLCELVKKDTNLRDIPVIFISVKTDGPAKAKGFDAGAEDYITKPFHSAEVLARVGNHLRRRELERAQQKQNDELVRLREFVRRFFAPTVFQRMQEDPEGLAMRHREQLTICFWDIRGFSKLCKILEATPDLIVDFLREFSQKAAETIHDQKGILDKFIGDGVMALFGVWAETDEQHKAAALAAAFTALKLQNEFLDTRERWGKKWRLRVSEALPEIQLGCGILLGQAFVGNVGTEFRDQFTAIGPDVNLASRLENKAGKEYPDLILVNQSLAEMLKDKMVFRMLGVPDEFRNIAGNYPVFALERELTAHEGTRA